MISYVDHAPTIELRNGHFLLTFVSGAEEVQLLLTLNACFALGRHAVNESCNAFREANVIPLPRNGGKGRGRTPLPR